MRTLTRGKLAVAPMTHPGRRRLMALGRQHVPEAAADLEHHKGGRK